MIGKEIVPTIVIAVIVASLIYFGLTRVGPVATLIIGGSAALAFVASRPFLTSAIIGATSMPQLKHDIAAKDLVLPSAVLDAIEAIHRIYTYPSP